MDRLWSPWRYQYVSKTLTEGACIFCVKGLESDDSANLIVARGKFNYILLNLFPYTSGHLMVAPYEHIDSLEALEEEAASELMSLARAAVRAIRAVYRPQGLNIGMNLGECAGAGVAGHVHMHVLPRWSGDANFMTTIGETRVMPEDLRETWRRLREVFTPL